MIVVGLFIVAVLTVLWSACRLGGLSDERKG